MNEACRRDAQKLLNNFHSPRNHRSEQPRNKPQWRFVIAQYHFSLSAPITTQHRNHKIRPRIVGKAHNCCPLGEASPGCQSRSSAMTRWTWKKLLSDGIYLMTWSRRLVFHKPNKSFLVSNNDSDQTNCRLS